jgi:hypothetical protein
MRDALGRGTSRKGPRKGDRCFSGKNLVVAGSRIIAANIGAQVKDDMALSLARTRCRSMSSRSV